MSLHFSWITNKAGCCVSVNCDDDLSSGGSVNLVSEPPPLPPLTMASKAESVASVTSQCSFSSTIVHVGDKKPPESGGHRQHTHSPQVLAKNMTRSLKFFVCFCFPKLSDLTIHLEWEREVFLFTGPVYTTPEIFINGYLFSNLPVLNPDKLLKYPCPSLGGENLHKNNINYLERTSYLALRVLSNLFFFISWFYLS